MASRLVNHPIFATRELDAAHAFLAGKKIDFHIARTPHPSQSFHAVLNGVYLSDLWLGYIAYGAQITLRVPPARGDYWVHFPLRSHFVASTRGESLDCDPAHGVVTSPWATHELQVAPDNDRLSLSIRCDAITRHLQALLGDAPAARLEFMPRMDLAHGAGHSLAGFIRFAAAEFDRNGALSSPLLVNQFEQLVLTTLLTSHPSNYTAMLRSRERPIATRDVNRAIDYIQENIAEPITLADLVAVSGVAGRTLIKHFRDIKGAPPMRYVRALRLEQVKKDLASGNTNNVTAAAHRWGFTHAGRFSIEYRKRFGETPSAALARGRRRA